MSTSSHGVTDPRAYPCWEELENKGEVPQSRSGHTCTLHRNRYLYVFGGFDGSNCFDDLYVLDLEVRSWRRIEPVGDRPAGRASHSSVADEQAGVMYIFGGSGSHFGYTNKHDLWEFSVETEVWRLLSNPHEDVPSARYGQSMVAYQEGLYVWGGTHGTNYPTDMHRFDLCGKQWRYVQTHGELPCGRYRHQAMVNDDLMYMVGGSGISRYGDVFTYHFGSSVWARLVCTGTDLSEGRYAHSAVLFDGYMYLYGGNDGQRHDDLQQLDLESRVWSRVTVQGGFCPLGRDFHAAVLRRGSMVIFGGSTGNRRHNDVYEFHLWPRVPPCTLTADLEALLDDSQVDQATQSSCDTFLAPRDDGDGGTALAGIFCHSHLLRMRCPQLYQLVQQFRDHAPSFGSGAEGRGAGTEAEAAGAAAPAAGRSTQDEALDDLFRAVGASSPFGGAGRAAARSLRQPPAAWEGLRPHSECCWVPVDMFSLPILQNFVRYLYAENTKLGVMAVDHLYQLFIVARHFAVPRLAALCERHLRIRLSLDTVLPLLKAATRDGPLAQGVQEACKHFFMANYHQCSELQDCEALDPKLLCELMRLHSSRSQASLQGPLPRTGGGSTASLLGPTTAVDDMCSRASTTSLRSNTLNLSEITVPSEVLSEDLARLLDEGIAADFEVIVQGEVINAHRFVLVARSKYFASCILTSGMVEARDGKLVIPETTGITADAFRTFLRFLYVGDAVVGTLAPQTAMHLVDAASFYQLSNTRLRHFCELCVRDSFNEAQVLQLFEAASVLSAESVRHMALDFIIANFQTICRQPALELLDKPLLIEIIQGLAERLPQQPQQPQSPSAGGGPRSGAS